MTKCKIEYLLNKKLNKLYLCMKSETVFEENGLLKYVHYHDKINGAQLSTIADAIVKESTRLKSLYRQNPGLNFDANLQN